MSRRPPRPQTRVSRSNSNRILDDSDDDDDSIVGNRRKPPRPSVLSSHTNNRRGTLSRRSSIRSSIGSTVRRARVDELYKTAVRMNAANKINSSNSWNLALIENLDRVLLDDDDTNNFTKASCTLDASVKIYGYRVDDVHLTGYKVLANLNRNETPAEKTTDDQDESGTTTNNKSRANKPVQTLETNVGT